MNSRREKRVLYKIRGRIMNERKYKLNFKRKTNREMGRKEEKEGKSETMMEGVII